MSTKFETNASKIQYINIKDLTDFLFSPSSIKKTLFPSKKKKDLSQKDEPSTSSKIKSALGLSVSRKGTVAPDPFAAAATYAKKNGLGFVVVDQDNIVRQTNKAAEQFLNQHQEEMVGNVFDYFLMPHEKQNVSITRENGKPGIGQMSVRQTHNTNVPFYLILIEDAAENKDISL